MMTILFAGVLLLLTAAYAVLLTPGAIAIARRIGAVDIPNARKIHDHAIPRLGGAAVFSSIVLASGTLLLAGNLGIVPAAFQLRVGALLYPSILIFALGIADDLKSLPPGLKFAAQIGVSAFCCMLGVRIDAVTVPFGAGYYPLGWFSYPVTVLWIAGVTNAFNLIDGLDGLASGVGIIASLTISAMLIAQGDPGGTVPAIMVAGALLGFLKYNFNPAKIFLGDSGSLLVGFALAVLSIQSSTKGSTAVAMSVPMLVLGLPILDTLVAMVRRLLGSFSPGERPNEPLFRKFGSIFRPDRRHIHHRLIALGVSHRNAVLVLYGVSAALGLSALLITMTGGTGTLMIVFAAAAAAFIGVRRLHYDEMAILRNGMLLPLYDRPLVQRTLFRYGIDLASSSCALLFALLLTGTPVDRLAGFLPIPFFAAIQVWVFAVSGLYRTSFRYSGISEIFKLVRAVGLSVLAVTAAMLLVPRFSPFLGASLVITDFYLLVSFVGFTRISFRALVEVSLREAKTGKRTLIYGADAEGVLMLQQILHDDSIDLKPVGFLDDDPRLAGKNISGYKVFGGHWNLRRVLEKHRIGAVLIASREIHPSVFASVKRAADALGVNLQHQERLLTEVTRPPGRRLKPAGRWTPQPTMGAVSGALSPAETAGVTEEGRG